jgi:DNA-binding beta-propeller fold protein YncE
MSYFVEQDLRQSAPLWPGLPEVPRYQYAGQLLGDKNFSEAESHEPGAFEKALRWIAGLGIDKDDSHTLVRPQSGMVAGSRTYVTDVGRGAIFVFDSAVAELQIWYLADLAVNFISPIGITAGPGQSVLVADSELKRIVRLAKDGTPQGSFGSGVLLRPTGLVRDASSGLTFVVDTKAHDIKVFDDDGKLLRSIGGPGIAAGEFNSPTHISIHRQRLYVSDTLNARVQVLTFDGIPISAVGKRGLYLGNLTRPKGVTVGVDGNIYVVESYYDHLLVFNEAGRFLLPIGGSGKEIGQFYLPAGAWSDDQGRIYIADMYNARIIIFQYLGS